MPFWPFRRRRNKTVGSAAAPHRPQSAKSLSSQPTRAATAPQTPVARRLSRRGSRRQQRAAHQQEKLVEVRSIDGGQRVHLRGKESAVPRRGSIEDITALPHSEKLQSSPHLRPVDYEKPPIPYNFRPPPGSQTSVQWQEANVKSSRPQTLRSKRSTVEYAPSRMASRASVKSRRKDDAIREEQIRAMSAIMPVPKRPGDGLLRRDSKKLRGRGSTVSLPPEGSIHSTMSGVLEQRGWEVGNLAIFNPRPAVRLSGTPQYVAPSSLPNASGFLYRIDSIRTTNKAPVTQDTQRKRRTVGNEANGFDASDLRAILERDTKRRARRQQERQEKLDRKLRNRASKETADGEYAQQREAEEELRTELFKARAEEERRARQYTARPTAVHPALREAVGESDSSQLLDGSAQTDSNEAAAAPRNPFTDAAEVPPTVVEAYETPAPSSETPLEEAAVAGAAQVNPVLSAHSPPISPVRGRMSPGRETPPAAALSPVRTSNLPPLPAAPSEATTPASPLSPNSPASPNERKIGGWASIFRRSGTNSRSAEARKSPLENKSPTSELSFSNTSRESMRNQPLPAHLIDAQVRRPSIPTRSTSGTPARTQSKFREDLPEMPISPPESRTQSPDVTTMAAAAAAARRGKRSQPVDVPGSIPDADAEAVAAGRSDTPVSPHVRGHGLMSASLASVDSEGSWLASGPNTNKRRSNQSALSRSLSKRNNEFSGSFEELGIDKDAEYISRNSRIQNRKLSSAALVGASPDEESEPDEQRVSENPVDPLTVHGSVRRRPTLVQRDPRIRSREGLLAEFDSADAEDMPEPTPGKDSPPESVDLDSVLPTPQLENARSVVTHGSRHSRQFSAGSAKLLDMPTKKMSVDSPPGTAGSKKPM